MNLRREFLHPKVLLIQAVLWGLVAVVYLEYTGQV
jgi:hypothetical protein